MAESWGKFVTEGSSVPHGLGQVCRREEPLSSQLLIITNRAEKLVLEYNNIHILYIGFV